MRCAFRCLLCVFDYIPKRFIGLGAVLRIALAVIIGLVASCSNSSDSDRSPEFQGRWLLLNYTLDDGSKKSVPADIQIGLFVSSSNVFGVQHGLCGSYSTSYRLDNDVLTTFDPVFPEHSCQAFYGDDDNTERSGLVARTFVNSEVLIVLSTQMLVVTTISNEKLEFKRSTL